MSIEIEGCGMLTDVYEFCRTPYPWYLAPMGYLREARGIAARSEQWADSWRSHLAATKKVILEAVEACQGRNQALILGSGPLLDVPLAELSQRFERVVLADIIHVRRVRLIARRYANVHLVRADVTGVAKSLFLQVRRRQLDVLPQKRIELFLDQPFDLVASVNLLSQLPVIPCQYLRSRVPVARSREIDRFARGLIENHLDWLARFSGTVAPITDYEREARDESGTDSCEDLLGGIRLPQGGQRWTWDIAPRLAGCCDRTVRHKVVGFAGIPGNSNA
jgi:hypothetical protein